MSLRTVRNLVLIIAFTILVGGVGYKLGERQAILSWQNFRPQLNLSNTSVPPNRNIDFGLFWEVWDRLNQNYIDRAKLDPQKMVYGAISGLVSSLGDPYTVFLTPQQQKETKEDLGGAFEGIGAELGIKGERIIVVAPLKDFPAEKAGLKPNDWILKVNGESTDGWTLPEAVSKIRGPKDTKVKLTVLHEKQTKTSELEITRENILVKSVEWEKTNGIAYLKLSRFGDQTNTEWNKIVAEINSAYQKKEIGGMVMDLRNNPGGYLDGAVYVAGEFLPQGSLVVTQEQSVGRNRVYSVNRPGSLLTIPLVILINKGSASASEIVAGALRDYQRVKLVGENSFGKGSVQDAQELADGAGLHITIAKWLLPKGDWINGIGIKPDIEVKLDEKDPENDLQLKRALELLVK